MKETEAQLAELDGLLQRAEAAVRSLDAIDWAIRFRTPEGFGEAIADARRRVHNSDPSGLYDLSVIFGPTGAWDDEIGAQGMTLANRACQLIKELEETMPTTGRTVPPSAGASGGQ